MAIFEGGLRTSSCGTRLPENYLTCSISISYSLGCATNVCGNPCIQPSTPLEETGAQICGSLYPQLRYPMECCAPRPATKFASAGLSRCLSRPEVCTRLVISEYASLVRKSYSAVSSQSVPSYWLRENLPKKDSNLIPRNQVPGRNLRMRRQADDHHDS